MRHSSGFIEEGQILEWIHGCKDETHQKICANMPDSKIQDLMVINCSTRRLEQLPARTEYVCSSYRWGVGELISAFSSRLPSCVAPLIEDCILLVQILGLKYLWVDRYCIPQDDPGERRRLIRLMGSIYSNALLTIIAAAGRDPSYGLPGVGFPRGGIAPVSIDSITLESWNRRAYDDIAGSVERSEWNERAWTYQEALLSRRRLVFTENGLYFQCG
ncbi:HET-domain-containing protein, partial [Lophiostoma macrostomum CBS 122681]